MTRLWIKYVLLSALLLSSSLSAASNRNPGWGGAAYFSQAVNNLYNTVAYSTLAQQIKLSVNTFTNDAQTFIACMNASSATEELPESERNSGQYCANYRWNMNSSFQTVSYYLTNTSWSFPQVYTAWQQVQSQMP